MSGILVFLALGTGATAQRALWFGTVFGAISLLFWEPGWRLGDWLDQRRHIRAG